jgi:tetratricopeptide (TPR) repeat protein
MRRGAFLALAACLIATAPLVPATALADGDAERRAQAHFQRGEKMFRVGRFQEALVAYQRAFDAMPLPELLFNIAQCYRNLGDPEQAIRSYRRYLHEKPDANNRRQVELTIAELEAEVARQLRENPGRVAANALIVTPPPTVRDERRPVYKRWGFWAGVAVVAAGATATAIVLRDSDRLPESDLGNLDFGQ